jgi:hypothetical protein
MHFGHVNLQLNRPRPKGNKTRSVTLLLDKFTDLQIADIGSHLAKLVPTIRQTAREQCPWERKKFCGEIYVVRVILGLSLVSWLKCETY